MNDWRRAQFPISIGRGPTEENTFIASDGYPQVLVDGYAYGPFGVHRSLRCGLGAGAWKLTWLPLGLGICWALDGEKLLWIAEELARDPVWSQKLEPDTYFDTAPLTRALWSFVALPGIGRSSNPLGHLEPMA